MLTRRTLILSVAAAPALVLLPGPARAAEPPVFSRDGAAISGTDPVAYFTEGRPVAGQAAITHDWNGAIWRFASPETREMFAADPEAYAPQYGGYCAYAVSRGYTAQDRARGLAYPRGQAVSQFQPRRPGPVAARYPRPYRPRRCELAAGFAGLIVWA